MANIYADMKTGEVVILRGVPGCGKSTYARRLCEEQPSYKRISKDYLRAMFDFGAYSKHREDLIREARNELIRLVLSRGYSVVVDDTNLTEQHIKEINSSAYVEWGGVTRGVPVRIVDFDTPLEVCIQRDSLRASPIGEARIREMWAQLHPRELDAGDIERIERLDKMLTGGTQNV